MRNRSEMLRAKSVPNDRRKDLPALKVITNEDIESTEPPRSQRMPEAPTKQNEDEDSRH